jgi:formate hydrogenlyase transcriptional activator
MQGAAREREEDERPETSEAQDTNKLAVIRRSSAEVLLAITDLIVAGGALPGLFEEIAPLLRELTGCTLVRFSVCDAAQNCIVTSFSESGIEMRPWDASSAAAADSPSGWVWKHQEPVRIPDIERETRFADGLRELRAHGVRSYAVVPMSSARRRYGALGVGYPEPSEDSPEALPLLERAARLVALAVENHEIHSEWEKQQNRLKSLVEIGQEVSSTLDFDQLLPLVFSKMRRITNYDYARLAVLEPDSRTLRIRTVEPAQSAAAREWNRLPLANAISARAIETRKVALLDAKEIGRFSDVAIREIQDSGVLSLCCVPLLMGNRALGSVLLGAARENAFSQEDGEYLQQVATQIAPAIHNAATFREVAQTKDRLANEKRYLESEISAERADKIIGTSPALKRVLGNAAIVAVTDATVLITGETGTGKERVARAIHAMSSRRDRNFIKMNCAAIPTGLLESELFGHEKGAFTGAVSQKVGPLELADQGTLLLDEIGEISLELQPKLLRVLQDQEFERLGGTRTIKVDVRVLAASNRDLARAVEENEFRSDLFYRLNVFPLHLPPLRERHEDIPMLIRYFVDKCAARMRKQITLIPDEAVEVMMHWRWPGNIRELENFIERSVILSEDERLRPPLAELREEIAKRPDLEHTLRDRERDHIITALRQARGVLSGTKGAAVQLGLKRTTLQHKMQKLGISRSEYLD